MEGNIRRASPSTAHPAMNMTDWVEEEESHATHSIGAHDFTPIRHNILFGFKH
ncbi:Uncharacterised protein [Vibrio cholerae]|nr:Uncharacterised protein [Vibrio cholerae]